LDLRRLTLQYIESHGTKKKWISDQLGIGLTHFSLWLKGERELADFRLEKLKAIISQ